jgi:hypothetical protein
MTAVQHEKLPKDRLKKALDSINEVLREVRRLQPSVPPLQPKGEESAPKYNSEAQGSRV